MEAALEEALDTIDVSVEVILGVRMIHRHHLWKIDEDGGKRYAARGLRIRPLLDEDVELVEVAVDEAVLRKTHDHSDEVCVQRGRVRHGGDLAHGEGVDERHDDGVSALGDGLRHGEAVRAQRRHEGELLQRREPRHVHPGATGAVAQVVAVRFDGAEGDAAEAVDFEDELAARGRGDDEDVGFFAHADLVADAVDGGFGAVRVQREVVEPAVGEPVAVVFGVLEACD